MNTRVFSSSAAAKEAMDASIITASRREISFFMG